MNINLTPQIIIYFSIEWTMFYLLTVLSLTFPKMDGTPRLT